MFGSAMTIDFDWK